MADRTDEQKLKSIAVVLLVVPAVLLLTVVLGFIIYVTVTL